MASSSSSSSSSSLQHHQGGGGTSKSRGEGAKDAGRSNRSEKVRENQVFVRNLSYDVTEAILSQAFEDIGPVKHVAISIDAETKKPKGFGFITFSLPEDALSAVQKMNGKFLKGRDMKLELYVRKGKDDEGGADKKKDGKTSSENKRKRDDVAESNGVPTIKSSSSNGNNKITTQVVSKLTVPPKLSSSTSSKLTLLPVASSPKVGGSNPAESSATASATATAAATSIASNLNVPGKKLQLLVAGLPIYVNKLQFRKIISKISRKTMVELVKEDHPLSPLLSSLLYPWGRIMLLTCPSRKDVERLTETLSNATLKSLGLHENKSGDSTKVSGGGGGKMQSRDSDSDDEDEDDDDSDGDIAEGGDKYDVPDMQESAGTAPIYSGKEKLVVRNVSDITSDELGQRKQKCRVIIRNLSFQANELNVALKLGKFGPLVEVLLPKVEVEQPKDIKFKRARHNNSGSDGVKLKPRGFAFATFLCEKDAKMCIQESAEVPILKICNREVAIDYSENKHEYDKKNSTQPDSTGDTATDSKVASAKPLKKDFDSESDDDENKEDFSGGEEEEDEDEEDGKDAEDIDNDVDDDGEDDDDDDDDEDNDEDEDEDDDMKSDSKVGDKAKKPLATDDVGEGCTVFVRDLPFDAESRDLIMGFKQFGRIELALLVKDKITGNSKGTAFVKFNFKSSAEKAVEHFNSGKQIFVVDRMVKVNLAVSRDQSAVLTNNSRKVTTKDKRNLYLANEGLNMITNLSKEEKDRLDKAQNDKKKKLTSPLFFVSPTRLSLRNLPRQLEDADLKHICLRAAKLGLDKRLVSDRDVKSQLVARGEIIDPKADVPIPPLNAKGVKAKIMLDTSSKKVPFVSKGFGFVEFSDHIHALACLRELSQYGDVLRYMKKEKDGEKDGGKKEVRFADAKGSVKAAHRVLTDFSVENIRKVQLIENRKVKSNAGIMKPSANLKAALQAGSEEEAVEEDEKGAPQLEGKNKTAGSKRKVAEEENDGSDGSDDDNDQNEVTVSSSSSSSRSNRKNVSNGNGNKHINKKFKKNNDKRSASKTDKKGVGDFSSRSSMSRTGKGKDQGKGSGGKKKGGFKPQKNKSYKK